MREKIQNLISIVWPSFDNFKTLIVESAREQFSMAQDGLTPERTQAIADFEKNFAAARNDREERLIEALDGMFTEEELDTLLAFYNSPLAEKATRVGATLDPVDGKFVSDIGSSTASFQNAANEIAKAFMIANTEGEVAASIAANPVGTDSPLPEAPPPPEAA